MKPQQTATSLSASPQVDRSHRMRNYTITMGVRLACFLAIPFVSGWWVWVFAAGAIVLPYFAVIIANVADSTDSRAERPERLALAEHPESASEPSDVSDTGAETLIVVDFPVMSDSTHDDDPKQNDDEHSAGSEGSESR